MSSILSTSTQIGAYNLKNRVIMAPLTRMRANSNFAPTELNVEYYSQRATAGLIISEASQISQQGQGYPNTPGIYSKEQIEGWKKVVEAIHKEGGLVFLQLWHVGRVSHSLHQPNNNLPVAPSAIAADGAVLLPDFSTVPFEIPHELTINELKQIVEDYRRAAINAKEAGFDGIEIHAANGYLIEQFLRSGSNQRTDEYGGSIEKRAKFLFEVLEAVLSVWENNKTAIRISPFNSISTTAEPDPYPLYDYVVRKLANYQLAYLHVIELRMDTTTPESNNQQAISADEFVVKHFREFYKHPIIAAGGFNKEKSEFVIEKGFADAVAFGRHYISTPDLAYRLVNGFEFNPYDRRTFYGGGSKGYTDYKVYNEISR